MQHTSSHAPMDFLRRKFGIPNVDHSHSSYPIGCEVLAEGVLPIRADIVFVHGLRGHRLTTWSKNDVCWPKTLLSEALPNVRIISYGYDANVLNFIDRASQNSLFDHSKSLLNSLTNQRKRDERSRPIIFVAHSLGGLIVKDALDQSKQNDGFRDPIASIFHATRGIVFLGTPHRGSAKTSLAKAISAICLLKEHNDTLIDALDRNSETLARIADPFSRLLAKRQFIVYSFFEELAMSSIKGVGKVVDSDSALIGDAFERSGSIHADHVGMTKFDSATDEGFKLVSGAIEELVEESANVEPSTHKITTSFELSVPVIPEREASEPFYKAPTPHLILGPTEQHCIFPFNRKYYIVDHTFALDAFEDDNVGGWHWHGGGSQRWIFEDAGDGTHHVRTHRTHRAEYIALHSTGKKMTISSTPSKWMISKTSDGKYKFLDPGKPGVGFSYLWLGGVEPSTTIGLFKIVEANNVNPI